MRGNTLTFMVPAEIAVHNAIQEVERLGASNQLTNAILALQKAKYLVNEHVDYVLNNNGETPNAGMGETVEHYKNI